jgi:diguanylate cyclase (GGDEF)-like protein
MFADLARRLAKLGPRRRLQFGLLGVLALFLLLAFLFIRTEAVDIGAQNRVMLNLRELEKIDAEWNAAILRAHIGRGSDTLALSRPLPRMHELMDNLQDGLEMTHSAAASDAFARLGISLHAKEQLVDVFGRRNPPLRAALLYLPPAVATLKTELAGIGGALAPARIVLRLDASLNDLLSQILRYNLAPSTKLGARIQDTLGDMEAQEIAFGPAVNEAIDNITRQSRVVLVNRPLENALEQSIAATRTGEAMDNLGRQFDRAFDTVLLERQRYRGWLLAYSAVLLALLAWFAHRLRRSYRIIGEVNQRLVAANETLEQRVAERTAELEAQSKQLELLAQHDGLTGLVNVRQLTRLLEHALVRAGRRGTVVVVMFIDLDGFKAVNDTWGHATGDVVLQEVARRVGAQLRAEDALARLGGDEFVILLEEVSSPEGALRVAQATLDAIRSVTEANGNPVRISASIGISSVRGKAGLKRGAEALLADADHAMYQAKQAGKGVFVISPEAEWATP